MKKLIAITILFSMLTGCAMLQELSALIKCEFSFHSAKDLTISEIDVSKVRSYTDLTLLDGQKVVRNILAKQLPFGITANIEVKNPGTITAAVNYIDWIAYIDDVQISTGRINDRIEIQPGETSLIPLRIETDIYEYLEGDNPKTMLNFGLNLIDAGGQPTRLSLKIKPSVYSGSRLITYPDYFTISKEFRSGK